MNIAVWLGTALPVRSIRWLDGALATGAKFAAGGAKVTAVAAGDPTWLDLAADRATRIGVVPTGVATDMQLDYLGWAQVMAAMARQLGVDTILVDEASRPERFAEVAAIAELLDWAQLTHVVALAPDGAVASRDSLPASSAAEGRRGPIVHASRIAGSELMTCRVRGSAVIGVRVAGPPIDEYPTPTPSASLKRYELTALGLDPVVLGHRALPPRAAPKPRRTVERIAEHLAVHVVPRKGA